MSARASVVPHCARLGGLKQLVEDVENARAIRLIDGVNRSRVAQTRQSIGTDRCPPEARGNTQSRFR